MNATRDPEARYIRAFFERALARLEGLDPGSMSDAALWPHLEAASSMKEALIDYNDDGNVCIPRMLDADFDAQQKLTRFLGAHLGRFGFASEREAFHLFPESVPAPRNDPTLGYRRFALDEYFEHLEHEAARAEPVDAFGDGRAEKLSRVEGRLLDFLAALIPERRGNLVFLLRDTLLMYLGARRLTGRGFDLSTSAVMVNRALLQRFAAADRLNPLYSTLFERIFYNLGRHSGPFDRGFLELFRASIVTRPVPEMRALLDFLAAYTAPRIGRDPATIVETGAHGTMPLLLMTAVDRLERFRMYTSIPWLAEFFAPVTFSGAYAHMRDLEIITCQDRLFFFDSVDGDRIIVKETKDSTVRGLAYAEIRSFLEGVDRRFGDAPASDREEAA